MRSLVDKPGAPIARHGINLGSDIAAFWDVFKSNMSDAKRAAADKVATVLADEHGTMNPGCMFEMYAHEIEAIVVEHGGSMGWRRSIEHMFSHEFRQIEGEVPASAKLALQALPPAPLQMSSSSLMNAKRVRDSDRGTREARQVLTSAQVVR